MRKQTDRNERTETVIADAARTSTVDNDFRTHEGIRVVGGEGAPRPAAGPRVEERVVSSGLPVALGISGYIGAIGAVLAGFVLVTSL